MRYFKLSVALERQGGGVTSTDPIIGYTFKEAEGGVRVLLSAWYSEANKINNEGDITIKETIFPQTTSFLLPESFDLGQQLNITSNILGHFVASIQLAMKKYLEDIVEIGEGNVFDWTVPE